MRRISHAMFAMAALILTFGPILESAARAMPDAEPGSVGYALQAFDVIDDVLDHLRGQPQSPQQQQLQAPHALPDTTEVARATSVGTAGWRFERQLSPYSTKPESQDPPPRA